MGKPLVVVESPTKVRTLKKYLGNRYHVAATVGHIKDLPKKEMGIDVEAGFKPLYQTIPGKEKVIKSLKQNARDSSEIYLAPDPDREGEAIAWHTAEVLNKKGRTFHRVLFHELTQNAILNAINSPEPLNLHKYEAQQARRVLDRLVGYHISPLLWKKVKQGLSAGRVQSVAVRIICERERAIQVFEAEEYWTITAYLNIDGAPLFSAKLVKKEGKKIKIPDEMSCLDIVKELTGQTFTVEDVLDKTVKQNPPPPFNTSKLQQEAIRKLRFSAKKAMNVAQQLYEGIDLGPGEPVGLITYMRTDSLRISQEAAQEAQALIREQFGQEHALEKPRFFKNQKKAQDAHEAVRPTSVFNTPEKVAPYLSKDQFVLYDLIWKRFVASQMREALIDKVTASIQAGVYLFVANGSSIRFPGYMSLYQPAEDEAKDEKEKEMLPQLLKGMDLNTEKLEPKQHFTLPPPRFSEASLVKELEENGIGRPSTYAAILTTIREKGYVDLIKGYFHPSELGLIVNDLVVENFPDLVNVDFTAKMEDHLDRIETAEMDYFNMLSQFYQEFQTQMGKASKGMLNLKGIGLPTKLACPKCKSELHIKVGKNGHFLACSGYPKCTYTANYIRDEKGKVRPIESSSVSASKEICEKCGRSMVTKQGKYGVFLACSGYPDCKNTRSMNSNGPDKETGVNCPMEGCTGRLIKKTSKKGKVFYGCNRYPDCSFALWERPVQRECPKCGAGFLIEKSTKKEGTFFSCNTKGCQHKEK
ncbi:MAG: type I DNA topoisomerase [Pseudomonadota bacterium]